MSDDTVHYPSPTDASPTKMTHEDPPVDSQRTKTVFELLPTVQDLPSEYEDVTPQRTDDPRIHGIRRGAEVQLQHNLFVMDLATCLTPSVLARRTFLTNKDLQPALGRVVVEVALDDADLMAPEFLGEYGADSVFQMVSPENTSSEMFTEVVDFEFVDCVVDGFERVRHSCRFSLTDHCHEHLSDVAQASFERTTVTQLTGWGSLHVLVTREGLPGDWPTLRLARGLLGQMWDATEPNQPPTVRS